MRWIVWIIMFSASLWADRSGVNFAIGYGYGSLHTHVMGAPPFDQEGGILSGRLEVSVDSHFVPFLEGTTQGFHTTIDGNEYTINQESIGLGMSYYWEDEIASPYVIGSFGSIRNTITHTLQIDNDTRSGTLYKLGIGYELYQWYIEAHYLHTHHPSVDNEGVIVSIGYHFDDWVSALYVWDFLQALTR